MHEHSIVSKTKTAAPWPSFRPRSHVQLHKFRSLPVHRTKSEYFFTPMNSDTQRGCPCQWKNVRMHSTKFDPVRVNSTSFWLPSEGVSLQPRVHAPRIALVCTTLPYFAVISNGGARSCSSGFRVLCFSFQCLLSAFPRLSRDESKVFSFPLTWPFVHYTVVHKSAMADACSLT